MALGVCPESKGERTVARIGSGQTRGIVHFEDEEQQIGAFEAGSSHLVDTCVRTHEAHGWDAGLAGSALYAEGVVEREARLIRQTIGVPLGETQPNAHTGRFLLARLPSFSEVDLVRPEKTGHMYVALWFWPSSSINAHVHLDSSQTNAGTCNGHLSKAMKFQ